MSSASFARLGSSSENSAPDWPCFLNWNGEASSFGVPLMNANRSPLMNSCRHVLTVVRRQRRLGIQQVDLRRRAGHEEIDDALHPRRELQTSARQRGGSRRLLGEHHFVHQGRQRETANAERRLLEEMAAGDGAKVPRCRGVWS